VVAAAVADIMEALVGASVAPKESEGERATTDDVPCDVIRVSIPSFTLIGLVFGCGR